MDSIKIGALIAKVRKEKGMAQKNIADTLGVSNKTVSKWECGQGCADISYWPALSALLGMDIAQMMEGKITLNRPDIGKLDQIHFFVCPDCGNILTATGSAALFCCGRKLEILTESGDAEKPLLDWTESDTEFYVTVKHPMNKEHYLSFAAYVNQDRYFLVRLYPEQDSAFRIPACGSGKLYLYCCRHGLTEYSGLF